MVGDEEEEWYDLWAEYDDLLTAAWEEWIQMKHPGTVRSAWTRPAGLSAYCGCCGCVKRYCNCTRCRCGCGR